MELTLNDGHTIPQIGLGTWPLDDTEVASVVETAVSLGYRHIDTAAKYGNESGVGEGIRRSGLDRSALFVTTKLDGEFQGDGRAIAGLEGSLERLGLEYVDLLLIHWPLPAREEYVSTFRTFIGLQERGLVRSVGVSNFTPAHLARVIAETGVTPGVNQIQLNPFIPRLVAQAEHKRLGIVTESWSPLGGDGADVLGSPLIEKIAAAHGRTTGQVVLRWHVQQGLVAIPKSRDAGRLASNLAVFDFELSDDDLAAIASLSQGPDAGVDSDRSGH
ncbi:aldo/keto reductase [Glaciihabitans arcticus]|uniref:Aldo/keto reductase n=1 Tax=Glaciihabitans arcticus TaxID=2668039 RepID=A0A4Q9GX97_9MICO|nr:aldo/keto reductase [Glaciihabitans arcticus]TBN58228.1 aldo/keto reductase [Glaciihabitans arcticus]